MIVLVLFLNLVLFNELSYKIVVVLFRLLMKDIINM